MKKYHACIVCGRKIARAITLPAGKIYLCTESACRNELEYKLTGSISVVGLDYETLSYHEAVCPEAVEAFKKDGITLAELANDVGEYIWSGETLGEMFHAAIIEAGQKLEKNWIAHMKRTDLPLVLMESLKSDESRQLLEQRLKGDLK
jgi:hypothetical protein